METEIKKPKVIIEASVTRKDGTIENLGELKSDIQIFENLKEEENNG
jgi:hypothetical protein